MIPRLYTVVAELTYRCPLRCLYCSNPIEFANSCAELTTDEWARVFRDAAALGALQLHLSGGEPALRPDLRELVRAARAADLYVNLITSGAPLDERRLAELRADGLDHIQLSIQDTDRESAELVAGARSFERKLSAAGMIRRAGFPLTLNVVLHRFNIERVAEMAELAAALGADRLELANAQYYGWAMLNRAILMPSREQYDRAELAVREMRERLRGKIEIVFVRADYFADRPKPCMGGWARSYVCITPSGFVLPCHAAAMIGSLRFDNVRDRPLEEIWRDSAALNAFRGEDWMEEPCRSCANRTIDFGGCRCQAFMVAGDARAADPVCSLSPFHHRVSAALSASETREPVYRNALNSRRLCAPR